MEGTSAGQSLPDEGFRRCHFAHWMLARIGKWVLRPGGKGVTQTMLEGLRITPADTVVELAPGLGMTTRRILGSGLGRYPGAEREQQVADIVGAPLAPPRQTCRVGAAEGTALSEASASVVLGEAFLSMQPGAVKAKLVAEAFRIPQPGGRYGLQELAVCPDTLEPARHDDIRRGLSSAQHTGARPLAGSAWRGVLEGAGFEIQHQFSSPMVLLRPRRVIEDEVILRSLGIVTKVLSNPPGARLGTHDPGHLRAAQGAPQCHRPRRHQAHVIAQALLVAALVLATSVWVGGYVAIVVVSRTASATLDPAARVRFFGALGRRFLWVGASSLVIALSLGATLQRNHRWDGLLIASIGAALALLVVLAIAVTQARNMTQLRRRALEQPENEGLGEQVTRGGHRAAALRAALGLLTLALVVLGAFLARC